MKYEAVFGNQELFDGAGTFTGLDVVVHSIARGIKSYARLSDLTPESLRNHPVCAMRRIIAEPKRWTLEDKKVGMLPEVGCRVNFCHKLNANWRTGEIKYMDDQVIVIKANDTARPFVYEIDRVEFKPIETPEEKAARLREEWCYTAAKQLKNLEYRSTLTSIYDALLSGEIPVPSAPEQNK